MDRIPGWPVGKDEELHEMYKRKLLINGWAGRKSPEEVRYIKSAKAALRKSRNPDS